MWATFVNFLRASTPQEVSLKPCCCVLPSSFIARSNQFPILSSIALLLHMLLSPHCFLVSLSHSVKKHQICCH